LERYIIIKNLFIKGSSFGELALLYNAPRSAGIKCVGNWYFKYFNFKSGFRALNRNTFRKVVEELVIKDLPINREFIESVSFFNFLNQT